MLEQDTVLTIPPWAYYAVRQVAQKRAQSRGFRVSAQVRCYPGCIERGVSRTGSYWEAAVMFLSQRPWVNCRLLEIGAMFAVGGRWLDWDLESAPRWQFGELENFPYGFYRGAYS